MMNTETLRAARAEHQTYTLNLGLKYSIIEMNGNGQLYNSSSFNSLRDLTYHLSHRLRYLAFRRGLAGHIVVHGVHSWQTIATREAIDAVLTDDWLLRMEQDTVNAFVAIVH